MPFTQTSCEVDRAISYTAILWQEEKMPLHDNLQKKTFGGVDEEEEEKVGGGSITLSEKHAYNTVPKQSDEE